MNKKLIKALEAEKESLVLKLNFIEQTIKVYQDADRQISSLGNILSSRETAARLQMSDKFCLEKYIGYDPSLPIRDKIVSIIKTENRFLHVREIASIAHQFEWHIPVEDFIKKISPALSHLKTMDGSWIISKVIANSHFNTFWGSRKWLDAEGEIKESHLYQANQLSGFNKNQFSV